MPRAKKFMKINSYKCIRRALLYHCCSAWDGSITNQETDLVVIEPEE